MNHLGVPAHDHKHHPRRSAAPDALETPAAAHQPRSLLARFTKISAILATDQIARDLAQVVPHAEVTVRMAAAKQVAVDLDLEIGNRVFEVTGARATSNAVGLNIFWRNTRTHSQHDPIATSDGRWGNMRCEEGCRRRVDIRERRD